MRYIIVLIWVVIIAVVGALAQISTTTTTTTEDSPAPKGNDTSASAKAVGANLMYCCGNHHPSHCAYQTELQTITKQYGCTDWKAER